MDRLLLIGVMLLGWSGLAIAESVVNKTPLVRVAEHKGTGDAYIGPEYFPDFYEFAGRAEESCKEKLTGMSKKKLSEDVSTENGLMNGHFFYSKNCRYSCHRDDTGGCTIRKDNCAGDGIDVESGKGKNKVTVGEGDDWDFKDDYYDLDGLSGEVEISPGYETQGKILFSWIVRVEGFLPEDCDHYNGKKVSGISVWPVLCHPWHGTSRQNYDGGQVKVQLYVQDAVADTGNKEYKDDDGYVAVGEPVEMTVPLMKSEVAVGSGSDPTLTGSYVVSADNFSLKQLPATVKYKIKWANHTAFRIMSPENQRSLVATLMPVTQE